MSRSCFVLGALAVCALVGSACTSLPQNEYYTLSGHFPDTASMQRSVPAAIKVLPCDVAAPYADTQIAYRDNPYRIHYDAYRYWAAAPAELLRRALVDCFRSAELFRKVYGEGETPQDVEYTVRVRVRELVELNKNGSRFALLDVDMVFTHRRTGRHLTVNARSRVKTNTGDDLTGFAKAMSQALSKVSRKGLEAFNEWQANTADG